MEEFHNERKSLDLSGEIVHFVISMPQSGEKMTNTMYGMKKGRNIAC